MDDIRRTRARAEQRPLDRCNGMREVDGQGRRSTLWALATRSIWRGVCDKGRPQTKAGGSVQQEMLFQSSSGTAKATTTFECM